MTASEGVALFLVNPWRQESSVHVDKFDNNLEEMMQAPMRIRLAWHIPD